MAEITGSLRPGETIEITRRGMPFGTFVKAAKANPRQMPDFLANLEKLGEHTKDGQKVIDEICGLS